MENFKPGMLIIYQEKMECYFARIHLNDCDKYSFLDIDSVDAQNISCKFGDIVLVLGTDNKGRLHCLCLKTNKMFLNDVHHFFKKLPENNGEIVL